MILKIVLAELEGGDADGAGLGGYSRPKRSGEHR
jgi:hypothetical protein